MEKITLSYNQSKVTKNFFAFAPDDDEAPIQGTIYVNKSMFDGKPAPQTLTVTVGDEEIAEPSDG